MYSPINCNVTLNSRQFEYGLNVATTSHRNIATLVSDKCSFALVLIVTQFKHLHPHSPSRQASAQGFHCSCRNLA